MSKKEKALEWASYARTRLGVVGGKVVESMSGGAHGVSREFYLLLKSIGDAKSKQEEDQIITEEAMTLKRLLSSNPPKEKMKEYVLRLLYCEMLGHEVEFGYVHALTLTQSTNLMEKKVGYLAVASFLHKDHPLMIMVVNSFRRDLESDNFLVICAALIAMGKLLTPETVPTVVTIVINLLGHPKEQVRKHALVVLHSCWRVKGTSLDTVMDKVRRALCDKNPSVMAASLNMFSEMIEVHGRERYMDLVASFVSILKQIIDHRLPSSYNYHQFPAPWLQIQLLQILRTLAKGNKASSLHIYEILTQTMKKANTGINIGFSIVYECVRTATAIYPHPEVLKLAASSIARLITSENRNFKCIGVAGLAEIVQINPTYAIEHQMALLDCLEDSDETLQSKTLELLYLMTSSRNVVSITEKMLKALTSSKDEDVKRQLVLRISQSAERHAPNFPWFVETMKTLFLMGREFVSQEIAKNFCELLAQGTGEASMKDTQLRVHALKAFTETLQLPNCPPLMMQVACWIMGEFTHLSSSISVADAIVEISSVLEQANLDDTIRDIAVTALWKLLARENSLSEDVLAVLHERRHCKSMIAQQTIYESLVLLRDPELLQLCLHSTEDYETPIDSELTFANAYVAEALQYGALPYKPASERANTEFAVEAENNNTEECLKWENYPEPKSEIDHYLPKSTPESVTENKSHQETSGEAETLTLEGLTRSKAVWGKQGYAGLNRFPDSQISRPVYTHFPVRSKYSSKANHGDKSSADNNSKSSSVSKDKKKAKKQSRKQREAAALLGFASPPNNPSPSQPPRSQVTQNAAQSPSQFSDRAKAVTPHRETSPRVESVKETSLLDLEEDTAPTKPSQAPKEVAVIDLLGDLSFQENSASQVPSQATDVTLKETLPTISYSSFLREQMGAHRLSHPSPCFLVGDQNMQLSYFIIRKPKPQFVFLFHTLQRDKDIEQISGTILLPENITVTFLCDEAMIIQEKQGKSYPFSITRLPGGTGVSLICECELQEYNFNMNTIVKFSYKGKAYDPFQCSVSLRVSDFFNPAVHMDVNKYSQAWKGSKISHRIEVVPGKFLSAEDFISCVQSDLNFHGIQVIGVEGICSALFQDQIILLHAKVPGPSSHVNVQIRVTSDRALLQLFARHFQNYIHTK